MKRRILLSGAGIGTLALVGVLAYFEPWRAFTSSSIDEALPVSAPIAAPISTPTPAPATPTEAPSEPAPEASKPTPTDRELSQGRFVNAEHDTNGTARIIELADGRRFLRLEGFSTSDGPDVHVWLSEATAGGSWGKYDDDGYVRLGKLKATDGNQNYLIPAGADISTMRSAVIWCDRFNVAFGAAPVKIAA